MASSINSFLKNIRSKTGSTSIKESRYGDVSTWISTGSLALNRIISGSIKKGIPSGRITILARIVIYWKIVVSSVNYIKCIKTRF